MAKTSKSGQAETLNVEQESAIDALLTGASDREAAEAVGVTRQTVTEWRNHHPAFTEELYARRQRIWAHSLDKLRGMIPLALNILSEDLKSENAEVKRQAAIHVLKAVGIYGKDCKPLDWLEEYFSH
jgi:hypothetical protein